MISRGYCPSSGCFGVAKGDSIYDTWICREIFSIEGFTNKKQAKKSFVFGLGDGANKKKLIAFFKKVENRLKIPQNQRIVFKDTYWERVIEFIPNWWAENSARRQLLTILLRTGIRAYENMSLNKNLNAYIYSKRTKPAIMHFLKGHTNLVPNKRMSGFSGWVKRFGNPKNKEVFKEILIK
jgi:hypothetical protein